MKLEGLKSSMPTKYSVQIGESEHLMPYANHPGTPLSFFRFINHSCSPNTGFDIPGMVLVALRDIETDEEIFLQSELNNCTCGAYKLGIDGIIVKVADCTC